jgi:hypothetical protein
MKIPGLTIFAGLNQIFYQLESVICHFSSPLPHLAIEKDFSGKKMPPFKRKTRAGACSGTLSASKSRVP